jgi:hypothetical protein
MSIIQVRGVSARTHRRLKAKAGKEGKSLSEYLRSEFERLAQQPTLEEMLERVASRQPVGGESAADTLRAVREERDAELESRR